jgi:hypothetical protein
MAKVWDKLAGQLLHRSGLVATTISASRAYCI